jgi:16S rRNA (uracil1498-N3)-methyltransferase
VRAGEGAISANQPASLVNGPLPSPLSSLPSPPRIFVAVGPEGGFTEDEVASALAAGWRPVDLGPRILRIETAAIFLAARIIAMKEIGA